MNMLPNTIAEIHGLQKRDDLNGHVCELIRFNDKSSRWAIQPLTIEGQDQVLIKPANLTSLTTSMDVLKSIMLLFAESAIEDITYCIEHYNSLEDHEKPNLDHFFCNVAAELSKEDSESQSDEPADVYFVDLSKFDNLDLANKFYADYLEARNPPKMRAIPKNMVWVANMKAGGKRTISPYNLLQAKNVKRNYY